MRLFACVVLLWVIASQLDEIKQELRDMNALTRAEVLRPHVEFRRADANADTTEAFSLDGRPVGAFDSLTVPRRFK